MKALFRFGSGDWPTEIVVTEELIRDLDGATNGIMKLNEGAVEICDGREVAIYKLEEFDRLRLWWRCSLFGVEKEVGA